MRNQLSCACVSFSLLMAAGAAAADIQITPLDPALGEFPEDVRLSGDGQTLFASYFPAGRVAGFDSATLQPSFDAAVPAPTGLALAPNGDLMVATAPWFQGVFSGQVDPSAAPDQGVWRVTSAGQATRVATLPFENTLPNGIAVDAAGVTYVSNLLGTQVYRVDSAGNTSVWLDSPLFAGDGGDDPTSPSPGFPAGGNGLQLIGSSLFISNTDFGRVYEIEIRPDGSAGDLTLFAESDLLIGIDGFQIDAGGNLFAASILKDRLVRVAADGDATVLADFDDGLRGASGIALDSLVNPSRVYFSNFSIPFPFIDPASANSPGVGVLTIPEPAGAFLLAAAALVIGRRQRG